VVEELRTIETEISSLTEELSRAQAVLDRTIVRAPDSGSVVSMVVNTVGGVIQPGATLMEVVPTDDLLIVEAQISPLDVDVVTVGMPAKIRLGSFTMDQVPELDAVVSVLSADRLIDEANGNPYYSARLSVDVTALPNGIELQPGMPADTLIITGQRTVLQYLVEPFERRLRRAFSGG
jgi:HlyD family type I secretion membrane fusion protein